MPENFEQEADLSKEQLITQKYNEFLRAMEEEKEIMKKIKIVFTEPIEKESAKKAIADLSKQIDDLKNQITAAEKGVNEIQSQYKTIEKEFFGLARLSISK